MSPKASSQNPPRDLSSHPSAPSPGDDSDGHTSHEHSPVHFSVDRTPCDSPSKSSGYSPPPVPLAISPSSHIFQHPKFTFEDQSSQHNASYSNKSPSHSTLSQNLPHYPYLRPAPAIPTLLHIPLLIGKAGFDSWDCAIRGILASMSLLDHIYDPSFGFAVPEGFVAVGPPERVDDPTPQDTSASMTWWRDDQIAVYILRSRLSPDIFPFGAADAKGLYAKIYRTYSARDWPTGKVLWDAIQCLPFDSRHISEYCNRWRSAFMRIRSTRYPLPVTIAIDYFLQPIPDAIVPILIIKSKFYDTVHTIDENDLRGFLHIIKSVEDCANAFYGRPVMHARDPLPPPPAAISPRCRPSQTAFPVARTPPSTLTFCGVGPVSPEVVDYSVRDLLNKLTLENFNSASNQIIIWANKSEKDRDGRTLVQVTRLILERAIDDTARSEIYARLCHKMMEQISNKVRDDGIKDTEGKPITGGHLFRKYLLSRCQESFERGWVAKEATDATIPSKKPEGEAARALNGKDKEGGRAGDAPLYSQAYFTAQKARRQGPGLIKFIGELFKRQIFTERALHECVQKFLDNLINPGEDEIESLCTLLMTVGYLLDTQKAHAHMDVYFQRMRVLTKNPNVSRRMQAMLQDVIELRDRNWVARNPVAAPATIAQTCAAAVKEKTAHERGHSQRQVSLSSVAGNAARRPLKAGDLSNFGKISKAAPTMFGPGSVFGGKKVDKPESPSRTSSNSKMPSMPHNAESADKNAHAQIERRRLALQPRTKPFEQAENQKQGESSKNGEAPSAVPTKTSGEAARKKINEDSKELFGVRNLDDAEVYFMALPTQYHLKLLGKLVCALL